MTNQVIPDEAIEAAHKAWREQAALDGSIFEYNLRAALEAAAPHMTAMDEAKLAAIVVLLDPFERVTNWMATDDEAGRYAVEAINKIRAILDTP